MTGGWSRARRVQFSMARDVARITDAVRNDRVLTIVYRLTGYDNAREEEAGRVSGS